MRETLGRLLLCGSLLLGSRGAEAQPSVPADTPVAAASHPEGTLPDVPSSPRYRAFAFEAQVGWGNPFGTIAVAIDYAPVSWLSINAGVGADPAGPQAGVMPRIRLPIDPKGIHSVFLGAGFAFGPYCLSNVLGCDPNDDGQYAWKGTAYWFDAAAGWELRATGGFRMRVGIGAATILNPASLTCDCDLDLERSHPLPSTSLMTTLAIGEAP